MQPAPWSRFHPERIEEAARRIAGVVEKTPLVRFDCGDERVALWLKLENRQVIGAFKARGAWNQVAQLTDAEREGGVVCTSSGNHGKALAWAAQRLGVRATIVMPKNAYANKIAACREFGAEVVLSETRLAAEEECDRRVKAGATLVHPYDAERTLLGAGTVGLEVADAMPDVELVLIPVGGGGLASGVSLALRDRLGTRPKVFGVEPRGAATLTRGLAAGAPVTIAIESAIQGLTPPYSGRHNIEVCRATLDGVLLVDDADVFLAQRRLVAFGETVEPAGSAACAALFAGKVPEALLAGRSRANPLRAVAIVSGGNPDPEQIARVRAEVASAQS
ncbi:MAG: threonine/serine dehydratase [Planctomycetes bacterium]|nr:threonine/serine dehydratase [Planctomycetota bacterium]